MLPANQSPPRVTVSMSEFPNLSRWGYTLTNQVQGRPDDVLFLCCDDGSVFCIGDDLHARRVLVRLERLASMGRRKTVDRWKAAKRRGAARRAAAASARAARLGR
jgi:hypothetical protein